MEIKHLSAMGSLVIDYGYFVLVSKVKRGNLLERLAGAGRFTGYITIEGVVLTDDELRKLLSIIGEEYDKGILDKLPITYTRYIKDINNEVHEVLREGVVSFIVNNHIHQVLADERGSPVKYKGKQKLGIVFDIVYNKAIIDGKVSNDKTYVEDLGECIQISKRFENEVLDPELQIKRAVYLDIHKNPFAT